MHSSKQTVTLEVPGALVAGAAVVDQFIAPYPLEISSFTAVLGTTATGGNVVLDLENNGVDLYTAAQQTIVAGATELQQNAVPSRPTMNTGDNLTLKIVSVGAAGTTGANLVIQVVVTPL